MLETRYNGAIEMRQFPRCGKPSTSERALSVLNTPCDLEEYHVGVCTPYNFGGRYNERADVPGAINYPMDSNLRKQLFPEDVMGHPAKASIHMMEDIWRFVSLPGQTVMDIFGGTGTTMLAAREGRKVVLLELEEQYHNLQTRGLAKLLAAGQIKATDVMLLLGDNRKLMPLAGVHHIMTSPPYSGIMVANPTAESSKHLTGSTYVNTIGTYTQHPDSMGKLPKFNFNMEMTKVYTLCYQSLLPGGTLTTIMGDYTKDGERVFLSTWAIKTCERIGFEQIGWFKRYMPGTGYKQLAKSKGAYVVLDEDILILRKPGVLV